MRLESQVCSLEQAKKLKEIRMPQDSLAFWVDRKGESPIVLCNFEIGHQNLFDKRTSRIASAFTLSELIEMLGDKGFSLYRDVTNHFHAWYYESGLDGIPIHGKGKSFIEAIVGLILKLHKEGLIFNDKKDE
jgi:hypothetical protein